MLAKPQDKEQTKPTDDAALANALRIADLAADKKAEDIKIYDVRGLTLVADAFVMCTVTSDPQSKAVFNAVKEGMKEIDVPPQHTEGTLRDGWMLMDYGAVIVHIFRPKAREFYDLDGMWADAPEVPFDPEAD